MSNENYKDIIILEILDGLHKAIRILRANHPSVKNNDGSLRSTVDFLSECHKLNNTIQQYIALQITAFN